MLRAEGLILAIAMVLVSACGPASGKPGDIILGKWLGTGSGTSCPQTELIFTRDAFTSVENGVAYHYTVLGIDMQSDGKSVNVTKAPGGVDPYWIIDNNHIQLQTAFGQCPYTREN